MYRWNAETGCGLNYRQAPSGIVRAVRVMGSDALKIIQSTTCWESRDEGERLRVIGTGMLMVGIQIHNVECPLGPEKGKRNPFPESVESRMSLVCPIDNHQRLTLSSKSSQPCDY